MKIGDKVQFLSEIGGGKIAGFQGKDIALVEDEDGFQIPTPISDLVVMSSGDEYSSSKSVQKKSGEEAAVEAADPDTFNMSVKAKINAMADDVIEEEEERCRPRDNLQGKGRGAQRRQCAQPLLRFRARGREELLEVDICLLSRKRQQLLYTLFIYECRGTVVQTSWRGRT